MKLEMKSTGLPSPKRMYEALVRRETAYDGAFFAGIRTTRIFCRPGCGARKPLPENVEYFSNARQALLAGYRPCKRCRPLSAADQHPDWVSTLLSLADQTLDRRLTAADLRTVGVEPARAACYFKRHFGMTFQAYHRSRRVGAALSAVRSGTPVLLEAVGRGFESERGFRDAFVRLFGAPPTAAARSDAQVLTVRWMPSPLGPLLAIADHASICLLEFVDRRAIEAQVRALRRRIPGVVIPGTNPILDRLSKQLDAYFSGRELALDLPIRIAGTPFQQRVWEELRRLPVGCTCSYAELAKRIGRGTAVRAVARANGDNRLALLIPCHRVIGSDGKPVGYGGGVWRKTWLLEHERKLKPRD